MIGRSTYVFLAATSLAYIFIGFTMAISLGAGIAALGIVIFIALVVEAITGSP